MKHALQKNRQILSGSLINLSVWDEIHGDGGCWEVQLERGKFAEALRAAEQACLGLWDWYVNFRPLHDKIHMNLYVFQI